jgi:hypothetical protein
MSFVQHSALLSQQPAPLTDGQLGALLFSFVAALMVGTLVGGLLFRAASAIYNKIVGGPNASSYVREPSLGGAMQIIFLTSLATLAVRFVMGLVAGGSGMPSYVLAVTPFLSYFLLAALATSTLKTTLPRALAIAGLFFVMAAMLSAAVAAIFVASGIAPSTFP